MALSPTILEDFESNPRYYNRYLDWNKILDTRTFVKEFARAFGKDQGVYLVDGVRESPLKAMNILYKAHTGKNLSSTQLGQEWKRRDEEKKREQEMKFEELRRRAEKVIAHVKEKKYERIKAQEYSRVEENFIKSRLNVKSNKQIAYDFMSLFKRPVSVHAIKAKKLRMKGTKKT